MAYLQAAARPRGSSRRSRRRCPRPRRLRSLTRSLSARLLCCLVVLASACRDPDALPAGWEEAGEPLELPRRFDLTRAEESARWTAGPDVRSLRRSAEGLAAEPSSGARAGPFLARPLPLSPGSLGTVEVRTSEPLPALDVGVYIRGRVTPETTVRAVPDASDPRLQRARFRAGRWNRRPVQGLRIVGRAGPRALVVSEVRITSEQYPPIAVPDPEADWGAAFAGGGRPRNAIVLMIDTLRADRLSLLGHPVPTSPHLEWLARWAVVFEAAWSQAACTFPSVNSLLTSQPAASFLGDPARRRRSLAGRGALAERLSEAGWRTWAVSASWVVRATPSPHNDWGGGYDAGFDVFDERCAEGPAGCVNEVAVELLDAEPDSVRPFFLYLHYIDPHDPYRPPASHARRLTPPFDGAEATARGDPSALVETLYHGAGEGAVPAADVDHLRALYDEEILYLDHQLFLLFEALRQRGLLQETLVVLASDHGESFLDHGHLQHCRSVYEDQIRTPLVVWVPDGRPGRRFTAPVQNLDLAPTLLDYLGVEAREPAFVGRSLRPAIERDERVGALAYSTQGSWQAATDGRFKWIEELVSGAGRLYDLERDPQERHDVSRSHPARRDRLVRALRARTRDPRAQAEAAERLQRELEALGYLE